MINKKIISMTTAKIVTMISKMIEDNYREKRNNDNKVIKIIK